MTFEMRGNRKTVSLAAVAATAMTGAIAHEANTPTKPSEQDAQTNIRKFNSFNWPRHIHLLADVINIDAILPKIQSHKHRRRHPTPAQIARREVTPKEFAEWSKVNVCEEGGNWHVKGTEYSGGLGISNVNWIHYGGEFFSQSAADATPDEQIVIARRIQPNPPDQNGCDGGW